MAFLLSCISDNGIGSNVWVAASKPVESFALRHQTSLVCILCPALCQRACTNKRHATVLFANQLTSSLIQNEVNINLAGINLANISEAVCSRYVLNARSRNTLMSSAAPPVLPWRIRASARSKCFGIAHDRPIFDHCITEIVGSVVCTPFSGVWVVH